MSEHWTPLDVADVDANPFRQFERWFAEAEGLMPERDAVALATASFDASPSVRMVLLRHHDGTTFGWYTNYESRKADQLEESPRAAILWYCEPLGRQIRIEGLVQKASPASSDAYFASRSRGSQLGAHASHQSRRLDSRATLEESVANFDVEFRGRDVPRPDYWGGYLLTPDRFEFWQHRDDRLHDRVIYLLEGATWRVERQSP